MLNQTPDHYTLPHVPSYVCIRALLYICYLHLLCTLIVVLVSTGSTTMSSLNQIVHCFPKDGDQAAIFMLLM